MDSQFIAALVDIVERSQLIELEYTCDGQRLRLARTGMNCDLSNTARSLESTASVSEVGSTITRPPHAAAPATTTPCDTQIAASDIRTHTVQAGLHGVFFARPTPDEAPFVQVGDTVNAGQTVALIEAMKMLHAVEAPCTGVITQILAENGTLAAPDTALFAIEQS